MPLDPTFRAPAQADAIVDLKSRLIVAVMLFATAPMPSQDGGELPGAEPAARSLSGGMPTGHAARSFLE